MIVGSATSLHLFGGADRLRRTFDIGTAVTDKLISQD